MAGLCWLLETLEKNPFLCLLWFMDMPALLSSWPFHPSSVQAVWQLPVPSSILTFSLTIVGKGSPLGRTHVIRWSPLRLIQENPPSQDPLPNHTGKVSFTMEDNTDFAIHRIHGLRCGHLWRPFFCLPYVIKLLYECMLIDKTLLCFVVCFWFFVFFSKVICTTLAPSIGKK